MRSAWQQALNLLEVATKYDVMLFGVYFFYITEKLKKIIISLFINR